MIVTKIANTSSVCRLDIRKNFVLRELSSYKFRYTLLADHRLREHGDHFILLRDLLLERRYSLLEIAGVRRNRYGVRCMNRIGRRLLTDVTQPRVLLTTVIYMRLL